MSLTPVQNKKSLKRFFYHLAEDVEEDVHLVPSSADDAPRTAILVQGSAGDTNAVSSRPSGLVVGIIKRNWHS